MNIVFIHGFLGDAQDWKQVVEEWFLLDPQLIDLQFHFLNLFTDLNEVSSKAVEQWIQQKKSAQEPGPWILIGYSLGGRLLLPMLLENLIGAELFIFISTHPGLTSLSERTLRIAKDQRWSELLATSWSEFKKQWQKQDVFSEDQSSNLPFYLSKDSISATEAATLQSALFKNSLGLQADFAEIIQATPHPYIWVTGEKDQKFHNMAQKIFSPLGTSRWRSIEGAGHRILFSHPRVLASNLNQILKTDGEEKWLKNG